MATPTTYAHFENAAPTGDQGLAVGSDGSEVTVASSTGALYQSGTAVPSYPTGHVSAASKLIAFGTATLDDKKTITTAQHGLTAVAACVVTRSLDDGSALPTASSLDPVVFNAAISGTSIVIRGYGISTPGAVNAKYVASDVACTVDWIAWGT